MNWLSALLLIVVLTLGYCAYEENDEVGRVQAQVADLSGENDGWKKSVAALIAAPVKILRTVKIWIPPDIPSRPNWTLITSDNKIYENVVITKVDPDCVTIVHSTGGGLVPLANLPSDLQKQLHYDPEIATFAAHQRLQDDQSNLNLMESEREAYQAMVAQDHITDGIHEIWYTCLHGGNSFSAGDWQIATYKANDLSKMNCTELQKQWLELLGTLAGEYSANEALDKQSITFLLDLNKLKNGLP